MQRTARGTVRTQWLALGAALVVLAGVLVTWALSTASGRVGVVRLTRPVPAGHVLVADDLTSTAVAFDAPVTGLVPARALSELVGRVIVVDLADGALLQKGMWRDSPALAAGERAVGVALKPGRLPGGMVVGDLAIAAALQPGDTTAPVAVRVLDLTVAKDGTTSMSLAVPASDAVLVAQLAATDQLVLVGAGVTGGGS